MNNRGYFERGRVKITEGQVKKHRTQMSEQELMYIKQELGPIPELKISQHLEQRRKEGKCEFQLISLAKTLLFQFEEAIVEFNQIFNLDGSVRGRRVLFRAKHVELADIRGCGLVPCNLCFVVDIDCKSIVTAYYNAVTDNHANINWTRYDASLSITG